MLGVLITMRAGLTGLLAIARLRKLSINPVLNGVTLMR
jgi:hypothetical protein